MTPEELDEARAIEAQRRWATSEQTGSSSWATAARLAREGWTPPEPVDPDVLAYREWEAVSAKNPIYRDKALAGEWDHYPSAKAFVAGARMAREQEQERAKGLVDALEKIFKYSRNFENLAGPALAAYKAGRAAR